MVVKKEMLALLFILAAAAVLRLANLSSGDPLGDEVLYAFRAIGPMDFDAAAKQTTPWEWFDKLTINGPSGVEGFDSNSSGGIPWWARLSWHDHPPLVFWVQHFFIKILGENNFAFRLPSAILGIASVYLVYLIGRRLFSKSAGLVSAGLAAVTVSSVFISRVGLQEAYVIFFILLSLWLFLKSLMNARCLLIWGAAVGLAGLTKYTALIIVPVVLTYSLLYRRDIFKSKYFWWGVAVAISIFSPVLIYNLMLYKNTGHFDFQLSYIFGQKPAVWQSAPGKEEIGTAGERIRNFFPNLAKGNSYILLSLFGLGLAWIVLKMNRHQSSVFLMVWLFFQLVLLMFIGPTRRFLTMLAPVMVLAAGSFVPRSFWKYGLAPVIVFEIFYTVNSQIIDYPWGKKFWAYSEIRGENYNWGYNELEKFLSRELAGKFPNYVFDSKYEFIAEAQAQSLAREQGMGWAAYPALIIYDSRLYSTAQLWILDRRQIYHGWPIINAADYEALPDKNVFRYNYFIVPTENVPQRAGAAAGSVLEQDLVRRGINPIVLKNKKDEKIFKIYKF